MKRFALALFASISACGTNPSPDVRDVSRAPDVGPDVQVIEDDVELPDVQRPSGPNGCNPSRITDMTASATPTITFGGSDYTPPCIRVRAGARVTFAPDPAVGSSFNTHPLHPGMVTATGLMDQPGNPITYTSAGMDPVTFTFPMAGLWGFYCETHFGRGMYGGVEVVQ